jgi:hypothetical protein
MPGGFHPFHAGHYSLYKAALEKYPNADVYVAATNDTKTRPFPFEIKEKLAKLAGVDPSKFVQVKSPFMPKEITQKYNPEEDIVVFVRSEKDRSEQPKPGGTKKDGTPSYFQPYTGKDLKPFGKQAYIDYLPTVKFGPGIKSATEIRNAWPDLNDKQKTAMVMSLYPATQKNQKLAQNVVKLLDAGMGTNVAETISEDVSNKLTQTVFDFYKPFINDVEKEKVDDYVDKARSLMKKADDISVKKKLLDVFKKGKENPYLQGGIITTVAALLAGGVLNSAQTMGLSPQQTNMILQGVLNTIVPTLVSRINGKNWKDTIKYTLASAGVGVGIAGLTENKNKIPDYLPEK